MKKSLEDQLARYAAYHRDRRNLATHFVGIPLIVLAIVVLLSRPAIELAGLPVTPAAGVVAAAALFYLSLDAALGLLMALLLVLALWFGAWTATLPVGGWLALGLGGLVGGWALQFVGHAWEGRKPAFTDDVVGLLIGPLFIVAEALFLLGLRADLRSALDARRGGADPA